MLSAVRLSIEPELFKHYTLESYANHFRGWHTDAIVAELEEKLGRPLVEGFNQKVAEKTAQIYDLFIAHDTKGLRKLAGLIDDPLWHEFIVRGQSALPIKGVHAALSDLAKDSRFDRSVGSNTETSLLIRSLKAAGLITFFPESKVFSSVMVAKPKPEPDLFLHAAAECGYKPADCIVYGDSKADVLAAKVAGMTVIAYAPNSTRVEALFAKARQLFGLPPNSQAKKLKEAGADYIITDAHQFTPLIRTIYRRSLAASAVGDSNLITTLAAS